MIEVINGNALSIPLPDKSVQCVVTSPPYWALRDYGTPGQLGLEPSPDEYVRNIVTVFREVWRVLRDDGTIWVNLGDTYNCNTGAGFNGNKRLDIANRSTVIKSKRGGKRWGGGNANAPNLRPKNLVGIPWLVAFALQNDGWYLRADIIWHKPNPMPESVTDRPTKSHEYLFLLSKSGDTLLWRHKRTGEWTNQKPPPDWIWVNALNGTETNVMPCDWDKITFVGRDGKSARLWKRINLWAGYDYYYDNEAVKEPGSLSSLERISQPNFDNQTGGDKDYGNGTNPNRSMRKTIENYKKHVDKQRGHSRRHAGFNARWDDMSKEEQCSLMRNKRDVWTIATVPYADAHFATFPPKLVEPCILAGSKPGDVVLDPFAGTGTVGQVAALHGRKFVGIELSRDYIGLARKRLRVLPVMLGI
jgi:DNA modification methylase